MADNKDMERDAEWQKLAAQAQAGDQIAYARLLKEIVPLIRRVIGGKLPSPDAADDVVQEVLISIHKALHTYVPGRPFTPWLLSIVRFRKTDFLRQHYAARGNLGVSLDDPDTPDYLISESSDGTMKDIHAAFDTLSDQQKEVVELMKIKGYSAQEVSEKTGLSVSAVKVSAHRAIQKLKGKL
ncbi:MAG: sigma-70 family RNA polymerase sigma factor [Pseudobdellovibrionaceae bacterium]